MIQKRSKKRKGKRAEDLSGLPKEIINHDLSEDELRALYPDEEWKKLPDEVYHRYSFTDSKKWIIILAMIVMKDLESHGTKSKTVRSKYEEFQVDVPQDRQSSFEPQVLPKRQKDISSIDDKIIAMYITNSIESVNSSFRKVTKKGYFPSKYFVMKVLYLRITELYKR